MPVDKSQIKPATTWRLEKARQRMLQQQQQQQEQAQHQHEQPRQQDVHADPLDESAREQHDSSVSGSEYQHDTHKTPQWNPQYCDLADLNDTGSGFAGANDRRASVHSFTKVVPNSTALSSVSSVMDDLRPSARHDSTFTVYSDASDRFSFDNSHNYLRFSGGNAAMMAAMPGAHSPASSTSSHTNHTGKDLRMEPLLPRSSPTTSHFPPI